MNAVVKIGKSQFLVSPGQELLVDRLSQTTGSVSFDQVLLLVDGQTTHIGQPYLADVVVKAKILGEEKGAKVRSATYTAKSRHRRVSGFRPKYTRLQIEAITSPTAAKPPATPKVGKKSTARPRKTVK